MGIEANLIISTFSVILAFGGYFGVVMADEFVAMSAFMYIVACLNDSLSKITGYKKEEGTFVLLFNLIGLIGSMIAVILIFSYYFSKNDATVEWIKCFLLVYPTKNSMLFIRNIGKAVMKKQKG